MKKTYIIIFFIIFNFSFSQSKSGKVLAEKLSGKTFTIEGIVDYANANITDEYEKTKFFYYWIGLNIKYDYDLLNKMNNTEFDYDKEYSYNLSAESVFEKRKAVCLGYSKLFKHFMDRIDIHCYSISGHIRNERNHYVELEKDSDFSHAWNVIEINDIWRIVDTTWGNSGDLNVSDYYFDIDPKRAIITHFPEKPEWQLLQKPLNLEEFNKSLFINAMWFKLGFEEIPKILKDDNYYYFTYKSNINNTKATLEISTDNLIFENIPNSTFLTQDGKDYIRFEKQTIGKIAYLKVNLKKTDPDGFFQEYDDIISFKLE